MMIGIFVSLIKSDIGTLIALRGPAEPGIAGGTSPSGKTKLLPGSYATIAFTL